MRFVPFQGMAERPTATGRFKAALDACWARSTTLAILLGLSFTAGVPAQASESVLHLRVADYRAYLPETHSVRKALHGFAESVQRNSGGKVWIDVMSGSLAGSPAEQIEAFRQGKPGAPQIMLLAATGLSDLQKKFELFDLPFAVESEQQVDAIVDGAQGQELLLSLSEYGLIGLAWMENGFRQVSTVRAAIHSASDFQGMKIRTLPSPASIQTFKAWGAQALEIPALQVHESLRNGSVQAQEGFVTQLVQSRLYEVQKHLWLTNHSYGAQVLVVRADIWRALNDTQRNCLSHAAQEAARVQRTRSREEVRQALKFLQSQGMQIHTISRATVETLVDSTRHLRQQGSMVPSTHGT